MGWPDGVHQWEGAGRFPRRSALAYARVADEAETREADDHQRPGRGLWGGGRAEIDRYVAIAAVDARQEHLMGERQRQKGAAAATAAAAVAAAATREAAAAAASISGSAAAAKPAMRLNGPEGCDARGAFAAHRVRGAAAEHASPPAAAFEQAGPSAEPIDAGAAAASLVPLAASDRRQPGPAIAEQAAPAAAGRNEIRAVCDVEDEAAAPAAAAVDLRQ